jgi:hypothetical protein
MDRKIGELLSETSVKKAFVSGIKLEMFSTTSMAENRGAKSSQIPGLRHQIRAIYHLSID